MQSWRRRPPGMAPATDQLLSERLGPSASKTEMPLRLAFYMKRDDRPLHFEQRFRHIWRGKFGTQLLPSSIVRLFGLGERPVQPSPAGLVAIKQGLLSRGKPIGKQHIPFA